MVKDALGKLALRRTFNLTLKTLVVRCFFWVYVFIYSFAFGTLTKKLETMQAFKCVAVEQF